MQVLVGWSYKARIQSLVVGGLNPNLFLTAYNFDIAIDVVKYIRDSFLVEETLPPLPLRLILFSHVLLIVRPPSLFVTISL